MQREASALLSVVSITKMEADKRPTGDPMLQPDAIIAQYLKLPPKDAMQSLTKVFRVGNGPSSSHTIAPKRAAERFMKSAPLYKDGIVRYEVTLYGSLAETGKGHLTDQVVLSVLGENVTKVIFHTDPVPEELNKHVNPIRFEAFNEKNEIVNEYTAWSVGGGSVIDMHNIDSPEEHYQIYELSKFSQLREWCSVNGKALWEYVFQCEPEIFSPSFSNDFEETTGWLWKVWTVMKRAIKEGLESNDEFIPGPLNFRRRAQKHYEQSGKNVLSRSTMISYALAVSEQNASAGLVVTAPTCGSCGVLPGLLRFLQIRNKLTDEKIVQALAVAGIVGNVVKANASVSGADVGCQGEVGVASAMAAAAGAFLLGGNIASIERAAEMALESFLGLTCCPVLGLVQVPCIDRNIAGVTRALDCAKFAVNMPDAHLISFDEVVFTMLLTGRDMKREYKETALGGEALTYKLDEDAFSMSPMDRFSLMEGKSPLPKPEVKVTSTPDIEEIAEKKTDEQFDTEFEKMKLKNVSKLGSRMIDRWHKNHHHDVVQNALRSSSINVRSVSPPPPLSIKPKEAIPTKVELSEIDKLRAEFDALKTDLVSQINTLKVKVAFLEKDDEEEE